MSTWSDAAFTHQLTQSDVAGFPCSLLSNHTAGSSWSVAAAADRLFISDAALGEEVVIGVELLRTLPMTGYTLRQPLVLTVYWTASYYWVAPEDFVLHGVGVTVAAAVEDYGYALGEYHAELVAHRDQLSPHLREHLELLDTLLGGRDDE